MNKINKIEKDIAKGFDDLDKEEIINYLYHIFKLIGPRLTEQVHAKARNIYYRYLVLEDSENADNDYLNAISAEFLQKWSSSVEAMQILDDLTTIRNTQHLTAVMNIVLSLLKTNSLLERALEIKRKKETT